MMAEESIPEDMMKSMKFNLIQNVRQRLHEELSYKLYFYVVEGLP